MILNSAIHVSASASHYDKEFEHYDAFNEKNSAAINQLLQQLLKQHEVKTVLDLACGTGSQVFHLTKHGCEAIGVDINENMLDIAQKKTNQKKIPVRFLLGDMRTTHAGEFDAVITIFNAIGHLTKSDFEKALGNIRSNLNEGGLYVFDIFNLEYLLHEDNITKLTIDWQKKDGDTLVREIQYSTINERGTLASYDIYHQKRACEEPVISTAFQTLQVYSAAQLKILLEDNGFEVLNVCSIDGAKLIEKETERLLVVAAKTRTLIG